MNWPAIIIGLIVIIILSFVFGLIMALTGYVTFAAGLFLIIISALIGGIVTGYMAKGDLMNGGVHGALAGAFAGIFMLIYLVIISPGSAEPTAIMFTRTLYIIFFAILGAIGGLISAFVVEKRIKSV